MSTLAIPHEPGGDAWDTLTLGGVRFDGVAVVSGDAFKKKIDKRRAAGADGARIVLEKTPGQGYCLGCGENVLINALYDACPKCGSYQVQATGGTEMRVKDLLVE